MRILSVIIPAYNCEKTIVECVQSVLEQDIAGMEVIVVDDGSQDHTPMLLRKMAVSDKRVRMILQENKGAGAARNRGIEEATGEYLMFVDADDKLEKHTVKKQLHLAMQYDYDFWIANSRIIQNTGGRRKEFIQKREKVSYESNTAVWDHILEMLNKGVINAPWGRFYKRSIIVQNNIKMDTKLLLGEDLHFNLMYLNYVRSMAIVPDVIYIYHRQGSSITNSYKKNLFDIRKRSVALLHTRLKEHKIDINIVYYLYMKLFFANAMQEIKYGKPLKDRIKQIRRLLKNKELQEVKKYYQPDGIMEKLMYLTLKSHNAYFIDFFSICLLLVRKGVGIYARSISV